MWQAFAAHYLFSFGDLHLLSFLAKTIKEKNGKIYRHKSMHVSRSTKPLTNHLWQVWRSIYNSHIDVKISPTKIWVHREQAILVNAQGHLYKGTRQNMLVTKHNNVDQTFWIFYFLCVLNFWHKNMKKLIKNNNVKTFKEKQTNKQFSTQVSKKHTTKHSHKT